MTNFSETEAKTIEFANRYEQEDFSWMVLALSIAYTMFIVCFRWWQIEKYQLNLGIMGLGVFSYVVIIMMGIIYTATVLSSMTSGTQIIIVFSFICAPLYIITLAVLYSLLLEN